MNKNIFIIQTHSFGDLTDSYKWCQYLKETHTVKLLCFDNTSQDERVFMDGIKIIRIPYLKNYYLRGILFFISSFILSLLFRGSILVVYFKGCKYLKKFLPFKKMILDIRTLAVWGNQDDRDAYDSQLRQACQLYDMVSVISEGVKNRIGPITTPVHLLPLGSDIISSEPKQYENLRLLYVGTFLDRDLEKTILGFNFFIKKYPQADVKYDIIGTGYPGQLEEFKDLVKQLELGDKIVFHGKVPHHLLEPYFANSNIGVSFVPITSYFNIQPPTKTYEYILSGLYTIATNTAENAKIIADANGIIIKDSEEDFGEALDFIYRNRTHINERDVRYSLLDHTWKNIVKSNMIPILENL